MKISRQRATSLLREMVAIPSPSGSEAALAGHLEAVLRDLGIAAHRDGVGNVVGRAGAGDSPAVLLLGHLDTVDRPLAVRQSQGRLYGRGAVDAKAALAAMICAVAARPAFPGRLVVAGVVEEETPNSRGAMHVLDTMACPDAAIVGEPSGWAGLVLGYKGQIQLRYDVRRDACHPASPLSKASETAVGFWHAVEELLGPARDHAAFDQPAATLRAISADPVTARVEIDCRVPPGFEEEKFLTALRQRASGGEVQVISQVPAVRAARGNVVACALTAAIRQCGGVPRPKVKSGTSDLNTLAARWSVPMAAYGPGDAKLDHSDEEHIELAEYLRAIGVLCQAIDQLGQQAHDRREPRP
jgi:LysW-gamma-L-lysine carboxypeptidase